MIPDPLFQPLVLPCGTELKNRLVKSAMSDSLGDGRGAPTPTQIRLYERWAAGGAAAMIIGEVQGSPDFAEKPGNLVLRADAELSGFSELAQRGGAHNAQLWLQLGHAGAMAYPPISTPKGPSAINVPGLRCEALSGNEIEALPVAFARTARLAQDLGFGGVQIHAAHGFLLSQFLSPLFNQRRDDYGGSAAARRQLLLNVVNEVRRSVDPHFAVVVKLNATDQLEGGLQEEESLEVVAALDDTGIDLIDISGGTYFPGAKSASDSTASGAYFLDFARGARQCTNRPLMVTGGFKTLEGARAAVTSGDADVVGLARALVLHPALPNQWRDGKMPSPEFPRFTSPPEGAITAWYTMRMTELGEERENDGVIELNAAIKAYQQRDDERAATWQAHFASRV